MTDVTERLSRGESVPGAPGACATCGHLTLWHRKARSSRGYLGQPCQKCDCTAFTVPGADPPVPGKASPRKATARKPAQLSGQLELFPTDEAP